MVALLTAGSAILLISCDKGKKVSENNDEALVTRTMDSMEITTSDNGQLQNVFRAPLMEDHAFAKAPFQEYRKGIELVSYDSLGMESSHVMADYALHWTDRDLWELKGNVFVMGENDRKLFTQQLSWDRKIKKIYSNVDSKVEEGQDVFIGEGFEADDDFGRWTFRKLTGRVSVEMGPGEGSARGDLSAASDPGSDGSDGREAETPVSSPSGPTVSKPVPSPPASIVPAERGAPVATQEHTSGVVTPLTPAQLIPQTEIVRDLQVTDTEQ